MINASRKRFAFPSMLGIRPIKPQSDTFACQQANCHLTVWHCSLPTQVIRLLQHLIGRCDGFGIQFVSSLCHDHVDHFIHDLYVGAFQISLNDAASFHVIVASLIACPLAAVC